MFRRSMDIGLCYTMTCPLTCSHCITESSPQVKGKMDFEKAKDYIRAIRLFSSRLCFTGGESLLYHSEIVQLLQLCTDIGLNTSLVSGAGWVKNLEDTRTKVAALAAAGLQTLAISWDIYHQESNVLPRSRMLAQAALDAGIFVIVRGVLPVGGDETVTERAFEGIPVNYFHSKPIKLGRAAKLPIEHFEHFSSPPIGACTIVYSIQVNQNGVAYACCGPGYFSEPHSPLVLGDTNTEPLEDILERAANDPILEVLSLVGPYGLYQLLHQSGKGYLYKDRASYTGMCDLCMDLTNSVEIIAAIREQLKQDEGQALVTAARVMMEKKNWPKRQEYYTKVYGRPLEGMWENTPAAPALASRS